MKVRGIRISDMPNIWFLSDPANEVYYGYRGLYNQALCPVCGGTFYYNTDVYSDEPPPTCGRYHCLCERFMSS